MVVAWIRGHLAIPEGARVRRRPRPKFTKIIMMIEYVMIGAKIFFSSEVLIREDGAPMMKEISGPGTADRPRPVVDPGKDEQR
jgi:hypothetical protein